MAGWPQFVDSWMCRCDRAAIDHLESDVFAWKSTTMSLPSTEASSDVRLLRQLFQL